MLKSKQTRFISITTPRVTRPVMAAPVRIGSFVMNWEREVYSADPTGGAPSSY